MTHSSRSGRWIMALTALGALNAIPLPEAVSQEKERAGGKLEVTVKRRTQTTDEDLRKQLLLVPEMGFDQPSVDAVYTPIVKAGDKVKNLPPDLGPTAYHRIANAAKRPDMTFLPWITGPNSELGKEKAEDLHALSVKLRAALRKSVKPDDIRPDPDKLRELLADSEWTSPPALPTLTQMMQAENTAVRTLLVELLSKVKGKEASIALAQRAIFDLSPDVRAKAVQALADRPAAEYTPVLYYGLRYPWAAAADHSAEAIVALQLTDLVPELVKLLREPNPGLPVKTEKGYTIQEVVRVNHLCNCMLCHAPSLAKNDLVRGRVPMPGEDPPPLYYQESSGLFVRADMTYLRQDFSVVQPVANAGKWAGNQRYDYLLRTRPLSKTEQAAFQKLEKENKLPKAYPQLEAVVYALRQLTGKDFGQTYEEWNGGLKRSSAPQPKQEPKAEPKPEPQKPQPEPQKPE
ncbi:MAG: HEAT repeat domain-containing protein [Planctomycetes bacterium]|nr:HEAT repeat domain-containing protein [Planctomycetota bacterium]